MNIKECKYLTRRMEHNVHQLQFMSSMSINICERMFYEDLIRQEAWKINALKEFIRNMELAGEECRTNERMAQQEFTLEELSKYDGSSGNKAYVAVDGVVYDVTYNAAWAAGTHFGLKAGRDFSKEIASCHDKEKIIKGLIPIGVLRN